MDTWTFTCCTEIDAPNEARYFACPDCGRVYDRAVARRAQTRLANKLFRFTWKRAVAQMVIDL